MENEKKPVEDTIVIELFSKENGNLFALCLSVGIIPSHCNNVLITLIYKKRRPYGNPKL